jgi:hypothetical protein
MIFLDVILEAAHFGDQRKKAAESGRDTVLLIPPDGNRRIITRMDDQVISEHMFIFIIVGQPKLASW